LGPSKISLAQGLLAHLDDPHAHPNQIVPTTRISRLSRLSNPNTGHSFLLCGGSNRFADVAFYCRGQIADVRHD